MTTSDEDKRRERKNRGKRVIKSHVKKTAVVVGVLAVMGISLFACKSKASNLKMETQLEQEIN